VIHRHTTIAADQDERRRGARTIDFEVLLAERSGNVEERRIDVRADLLDVRSLLLG
jgi:hypothetical protein